MSRRERLLRASRTVEALFDMRCAVGVVLALRAAEWRTEAHLAELAATERILDERVAARDYPAVPAINRVFHGVINDAADNPGALSPMGRYWELVAALWRRYGYEDRRFHGVIDDYRHLVLAIELRDGTSTAALAGAHIENAKHGLMTRMEADPNTAK